MNCPACERRLPDDAAFCGYCGSTVRTEQTCPSCGRLHPPEMRFCLGCGSSLGERDPRPEREPRAYTPKHLADRILQSKAALEGERKQVTVLFCDVKGSTELSGSVDAEDWHRVMDRFLVTLAEGVHRFEGTVNQYTGDGIMALFGAPIAHEDHAQRACFAALWLRDDLRRYADRVRLESGLSFAVRMGLNSGDVVVGKIGDDLRMDYTAQGHTVNLAARMEQIAEPGAIYLTEATARLAQGYFELRALGETRVKGVAEPVAVSELVGPGRLRTRFDLSRARGLSRFVGRREEMRQLEAALERARAGKARIVGVVAEAGTGKSRLCYEFGERCRERGIELWSATCPPHGRSIPLSFNCAVVRAWLGVSELDSDEETRDRVAARMVRTDPELASLVPFVFDLLGVTEPGHAPPQLNAEARQQRFLQLAERILIGGRDEMLVALLDDVQWIDKTSEDAQVEIHRMEENTRTLTILNYRPEYRPPSADRPNFTELRLHPLTAESTAELLADLLGPEAQGRGLEGAIQGRAGGNPFFVEEIVQELAESGHLEGVRGAYRLARPVTSLAVPDSVHAVLAARIDRLEEEPKRVLQAASVIGKSFGVTLLGCALSSEIDRLAPVLHELAEAEFVFQEAAYPEEVWRFKHPVTQEVAYETLLRATRARMHAALAAALVERHVDRPDEHAALIAYHFERADEREQAARWHGRAAVWAGSNAPRDAIDHWERVRALLEDVEQSDEFVALAYAASTQLLWNGSRMGMDRERGLALLEDAHRAVEQLGDERAVFALHMLAFVSLAMLGEDPGTRAEQMLELASRSIDPWIRRAALLVAGRATIFRGDPADGVRAFEEALAMDELEPDLVGGVRLRGATDQELMMWKGMGELWLGRVEDAAATLERAVELAERANDLPYLATAHALAARAAALRLDVAGALRHAQRCVEIEERVGSRAGLYFAHSALMHALARAGRWEEARAEIDRIREIDVNLGGGTNSFQLYFWGDQIEVLLACGESDAAREVAHAVLAAQLRLDDGTAGMLIPLPDAPIQAARALLRLDGAGASAAVARLLESAERSVAGGRRVFAPELALARADQAAVEGDAVGAERWRRRAVVQLRELGLERRAAAVLAEYDL